MHPTPAPLKLTGSAQRAMEVPHDAHDSSERSHCTAISAHFTRYMSNVGLRNATTATRAVALNRYLKLHPSVATSVFTRAWYCTEDGEGDEDGEWWCGGNETYCDDNYDEYE